MVSSVVWVKENASSDAQATILPLNRVGSLQLLPELQQSLSGA